MKLKDLGEYFIGLTYKPEDVSEKGTIVLRSGNIQDGQFDLSDIVRVKTVIREKQYVKPGDILMCSRNGSARLVGKSTVIPTLSEPMTFGAFMTVFRTQYNDYLKFFLQSKYFRTQLAGSKTTTINQITIRMLDGIDIDLPDYSERENRIKKLEVLQRIIWLRKQELRSFDELVKARFVEMFGNMPRTIKVGDYISELRGGKSLAGTEPCINKVLKTGAATFGWFDPKQYKYLPFDYVPLPEHKVETGDVIISRMNTPDLVGACSYVFEAPENMYYPDRLWKTILKTNADPIFIWQLLWDPEIRREIKERSGGTSGTMHNISKSGLLSIKCVDVPLNQQQDYAGFVRQVNKSKLQK